MALAFISKALINSIHLDGICTLFPPPPADPAAICPNVIVSLITLLQVQDRLGGGSKGKGERT